MRSFIILLFICFGLTASAQQKLAVKIIDEKNRSANIVIKGSSLGYSTDSSGIATVDFPSNGNYTLITLR